MTTELISLQKRADDLANRLSGEDCDLVRELRSAVGQLFELKAKLRSLGE